MAASLRQGGGSIARFQGSVNYCAWSRLSCTDDPWQRPCCPCGSVQPFETPGKRRENLKNLIRPLQERRRDREADRLRGLEVDHQLEFGGLLDGKLCR